MKQEKYMFIRVFVTFLLCCILLTVKVELIEKPQKREMKYSYTQTQIDLNSFGKCDTAGGFVYFTYRSRRTLVAIYDMKGNYLQTIEFTDFNNGDISLRSKQDQMVLQLRNDNVFIIQGKNIIAGMTKEEADKIGYTNDWFRGAEKRYEVTEDAIRVYNEEGDACTFWLQQDRIAFNRAVRFAVWVAAIIVAVFISKRIKKKEQ